jgi:hypothetical protein
MTNNELVQQLIVNTLNGNFSIDQIENLSDILILARKRFTAENISPDIKDENDDQIRRNNGLLPLRIDNYSGNPNKKYYKFNHEDQRSGISYYNLKDEYRNEIIGIENMYS